MGGKVFFDDDQQTPDTMNVTFPFGRKALAWEMRVWNPYGMEGQESGVAVYGTAATIHIGRWNWRWGYKLFDNKGKFVQHNDEGDHHVRNFVDCIWAHPPRMCRWPLWGPPAWGPGAVPSRLAAVRRPYVPRAGMPASRAATLTGPRPGMEARICARRDIGGDACGHGLVAPVDALVQVPLQALDLAAAVALGAFRELLADGVARVHRQPLGTP